MNRMTKKRVGIVLAFSLTLTGAAAYIGIQQENTDKTEAAGSLTAGVSASLNASGGAGCDGRSNQSAV